MPLLDFNIYLIILTTLCSVIHNQEIFVNLIGEYGV